MTHVSKTTFELFWAAVPGEAPPIVSGTFELDYQSDDDWNIWITGLGIEACINNYDLAALRLKVTRLEDPDHATP